MGNRTAFFALLIFSVKLKQGSPVFTVPKFITIENGNIMGTRQVVGNVICDVFLGIPYAQPPIGRNRFKGTLITDTYAPACAQPVGKGHMFLAESMKTSEDCLYLNVFSPVNTGKTETKYPVFVWIHGGGFLYGSSSTILTEDICNSFSSQGVIVVTFNYRLGPFGFLKSPNISEGNVGLWDQVELLRWIRGNIGYFGGDPNRVSVGGHGSGAVCASILSLANISRGLFNQAVIMSGSILSSWAITDYPIASTYQLTEALQCRLLFNRANDCLANATTDEILLSTPKFWSPVFDGPDGLINKSPIELLSDSDMPVIIGFTKEEAAMLVLKKLALQNGSINSPSVQHRLIRYFSDDFLQSLNTLEEAVKFQYFNLLPNQNGYVYIQNLVDLYSDYLFKSPIVYEATVRSQHHSNVYMYSFEKTLDLSQLLAGWVVSPHEADLAYLWGWNSFFGTSTGGKTNGRYAVPILASLWGSFIKFGFIQSEALSGVWMPFRSENKSILKIGNSLQMGTLKDEARLRLWTMFVPQILKLQENVTNDLPQATTSTENTISEKLTTRRSTFTASPTTNPESHDHHSSIITTAEITTTTKKTTIITTTVPPSTITSVSVTVSSTAAVNDTSSSTIAILPAVANDSIISVKKQSMDENSTALWAMVGLALVFFILFLFTAAFCAVWHKQSYCINRAMRIRNVIRPPVIVTAPTVSPPAAAAPVAPVPIRPETHPSSRPAVAPPNPALSARRR